MPFSVAVATATAIGMVVGFAMYKHFVFPGSKRAIASQIRDFVIVNIASMALVTGVAAFFVRAVLHQMGIFIHAEGLVHAIGIGAGAVSNFFGHTTISFRVPSAGIDQRC